MMKLTFTGLTVRQHQSYQLSERSNTTTTTTRYNIALCCDYKPRSGGILML